MNKWEQYKLDDICTIKGGKRLPDGHELTAVPTKHPYIKARDIKNGKILVDNLEYIDDNTHNLISRYIVKENDICITIVGANIGDAGIVSHELNNANLTENAVRLTGLSSKVSPKFLAYVLASKAYKNYCEILAGGAAQPKLGLYKLKIMDISLPTFSEQQLIADILSAYDDLIEVNNKRISILEQMAEQIYKEWFVRMRFPGYENTEFEKGVPKSWVPIKLSEIVQPQYGFTESSIENNELPKFLRVMDINKNSYIDWSTVPNCFISDHDYSKYSLNKYDIVIARMADPGKVAIIEDDISSVFASYLIKLKLKKEFKHYYYFLFYTLSNPSLQGFFSGSSSGTTRATINAKALTSVRIIIPCNNLIFEFTKQVKQIRDLLYNLVKANANLKFTRNLLLPRLISGKLRIKDIKEP